MRPGSQENAWQFHSAAPELAIIGPENVPALESTDLWMGAVKCLQHGLGAQSIGQTRSHKGASAGPYIDVQIIDGAVNQQIVNGSQSSDLVH